MQCHAPGCMWHAQYSESRNAYGMLSSNIRRSSTTSNPAATLPNLPGVRATMQSLSSPHAPSSRETPPCTRCSVSGCPCLWTRQKHCHCKPAVAMRRFAMHRHSTEHSSSTNRASSAGKKSRLPAASWSKGNQNRMPAQRPASRNRMQAASITCQQWKQL